MPPTSITKELSAITRELFNLQNTMDVDEAIRRAISVGIDATTSTVELEEAEIKRQNAREEKAKALFERAKDAELKVRIQFGSEG